MSSADFVFSTLSDRCSKDTSILVEPTAREAKQSIFFEIVIGHGSTC
jgi:hypothetical protein